MMKNTTDTTTKPAAEIMVTLDSGAVVPLSLAIALEGAEARPQKAGLPEIATGRDFLRHVSRRDLRARAQKTLRVSGPRRSDLDVRGGFRSMENK